MRAAVAGTIAAAFLASSAGLASAQSAPTSAAGQHAMEGRVTKVDAKKGWVHVKTSEGTMIVHFPPDAIQDLHTGDTITVRLALKDNGPAPKK